MFVATWLVLQLTRSLQQEKTTIENKEQFARRSGIAVSEARGVRETP